MPTKRTVDQIKANLLRPALTSYFEVEIPKISSRTGEFESFLSNNGVLFNQEKLNLLCSETSLPGSSLATHEINNDYMGVTERHAYRRIYDDRIDFSFYVDAENYLPIRYFESWIKWIVDESIASGDKGPVGVLNKSYFYRMKYPDDYVCDSGLKITKFERDHTNRSLEYEFVRAYPISITSMPVSYDTSSLLKCTVSFTYLRYVLKPSNGNRDNVSSIQREIKSGDPSSPVTQAAINGSYYGPAFQTNEEANRQAAILRGENVQ
jgi:hypothetical protein